MGRSFFKSNLLSSTRPNPLEAFVFDGGQGPVTFINSIAGRAFIERVKTEAAADFEMYASFFPVFFILTHFVRSDWIMYFFTFMVGAAHYGLQVGKRFHKSSVQPAETEIVTIKTVNNWIKYALPPPYYLTATPKQTCLICLIVFVVAPDLGTFTAFNRTGRPWGLGPKDPSGSLCITYLPGGDVLLHISSPHDLQTTLRADFIKQQRLLGVVVVFSADDRVTNIPIKGAEPQDFDADEAEEVELRKDATIVRRLDWW